MSSAPPARVAVIGGGISGLASAYRLSTRGYRVTVFEGEPVLGGLGVSFPYRAGNLERFYHCILPDDTALIRLIHDVGLGDDLLWRGTDMGFMYQGRVYSMNTAMDLLRFSPLSLVDRLRMGLMGIRARRNGTSPDLDHVPVDDWIKSQVGSRAFDILWKPLLEAKIGDSFPGLPALWLSSRMSREKNTKREVKGCLRRGHQSLVGALEAGLLAHGARIRLGTRVEAIDDNSRQMVLRLDGGSSEAFDMVVATSPLVPFQRMTSGLGLSPAVSGLSLDYQGVISGVFLLEKPLSRYYWMPIVDSGATCQGVVEMSNLVPLDRSQNLYVTYLVNYTHRESDLFKRTDAELLELYRSDLANLFPVAGRTIIDQFLFRAPFVEPIWPLGYNAMRPPTTVIPGRLYLASTAQVYPSVNSWNSCCEVVDEMVEGLLADAASMTVVGAVA
ncbi:MAG: FAD-dependent oxidoreductase [Chloroflexota bacterium]